MIRKTFTFITPVDIRYSYRGTEKLIYEYANYLSKKGISTEICIPSNNLHKLKILPDRTNMQFTKIAKCNIKVLKLKLPLNFDLYFYLGLPKNSIIYFPYSVFNHIFNLMLKPKKQIYIIGQHSLHLKENGRILRNNYIFEELLCHVTKFIVRYQRDSSYYHVINTSQIKYLLKLGVPPDKIIFAPDFIDIKKYKFTKNTTNKLRILHIGGDAKNAPYVANIIESLVAKSSLINYEFHFIGEISSKVLLKLQKLHPDSVYYHGIVTEKEKQNLLSKMDVMIITSVETFGISMLEGMACGLYILSRRNPTTVSLSDKHLNLTIINFSVPNYVTVLKNLYKLKQSKNFTPCVANRYFVKNNYSKDIALPLFYKSIKTVLN